MDVVEDNIHILFVKRDLNKIIEYMVSKIDKNEVFHFNKAGVLCFAKDMSKFDLKLKWNWFHSIY